MPVLFTLIADIIRPDLGTAARSSTGPSTAARLAQRFHFGCHEQNPTGFAATSKSGQRAIQFIACQSRRLHLGCGSGLRPRGTTGKKESANIDAFPRTRRAAHIFAHCASPSITGIIVMFAQVQVKARSLVSPSRPVFRVFNSLLLARGRHLLDAAPAP